MNNTENPTPTRAVAYYRTSSQTNVGEGKDTLPRQQRAVGVYAAEKGYQLVGEYYDAAVKGADPVDERPEFGRMLADMDALGATVIMVENAGRFARDMVVQTVGYNMLKKRGITIIPVDAPDHFLDDSPTAEMIRGILGLVSQFERKSTMRRMHAARERQRGTGKGGLVDEGVRERARELVREGYSLRQTSAVLETEFGRRYQANSVRCMVKAWGGR